MIQVVLSGMITLMLAKFVLNDVPHAAGLLNTEAPPAHMPARIYCPECGEERWTRVVSRQRQCVVCGYVLEGTYQNPGPVGTCYPDAWRFLIKHEGDYLIHGSVQLSPEGPRTNHAWVETTYEHIWEPQTKQYFTAEDFNRMFAPVEDARYSGEEAAIMLARVGKHGPWSAEEKEGYIGG